MGEGDFEGNEGMAVVVVFTVLWFVCLLTSASILLILRCLGCSCWCQGGEEMRDS